MNIYKEIKQIAELNEKRTTLINNLEEDGLDTYELDLGTAWFERECVEKDGHLYNKDGERLDNCGLVDNDYYCKQYQGYIEDDYYGTIYYATDEKGVFVAVPFAM